MLLFIALPFGLVVETGAQTKRSKSQSTTTELARLREEFVEATNEYKSSLAKLLLTYEANVRVGEERLLESRELFDAGLISKSELTKSETAVAEAQVKVAEARQQIVSAESQIATILVEAQAETQLAKTRPSRGSLVKTTAYVRYHGVAAWSLSEAWKVQQFFLSSFKTPLPIAVFGQGPIHDRWRLDHREAMDVSLHPDSIEGQSLMAFLRANGIPFLAFRTAIPGTSTGPHIHIGRPSHRF